MFNLLRNHENNLQGTIFSSKLRLKVLNFKRNLGTLTNPSEKKAVLECFTHLAALSGSDKKRSMANLTELTVNDKVVWEPQKD